MWRPSLTGMAWIRTLQRHEPGGVWTGGARFLGAYRRGGGADGGVFPAAASMGCPWSSM